MGDLLIKRSAVFSDDLTYRVRLDREMGPGRVAVLCGVNPSTAGADVDDQTIRKDYGFCARLGVGRFIKVNLFSHVATDVRELRSVRDPVGPENDRYIEEAFREADLHIMCWGPLAKLPPNLRYRWRQVVAIAERVGCDLHCLGTAKDGQPRHPLTLAYATALEPWSVPR